MKQLVNVRFKDERSFADEYVFVSYEPLEEGDMVVVDTRYGFQLAKVSSFPDALPQQVRKMKMKEVVCKVDFSVYAARKERAEKLKELKNKMDLKVEQLKEKAVYEMMAKDDPVLKALLDEYNTLENMEDE